MAFNQGKLNGRVHKRFYDGKKKKDMRIFC